MIYMKIVNAPFHFWTVFFCELHKGVSASAQTPLCLILRINYELFQ